VLPMRLRRCAVEYLPDPARRSFGNCIGELVTRKEPAFHDLIVWRRNGWALPVAYDENRDMVTRKRGKIGEEPVEVRLPLHHNASLLKNPADHRGLGGLAPLDASAREMPSPLVAMTDEKYAAILASDDPLGAKGCAPG